MADDANELRQIKNAMTDLSLGAATLDGVLDALGELHRLRHLYPPLRERERVAVNALEDIANHANGRPLGHVVNVTKLSGALAAIAQDALRPLKADGD